MLQYTVKSHYWFILYVGDEILVTFMCAYAKFKYKIVDFVLFYANNIISENNNIAYSRRCWRSQIFIQFHTLLRTSTTCGLDIHLQLLYWTLGRDSCVSAEWTHRILYDSSSVKVFNDASFFFLSSVIYTYNEKLITFFAMKLDQAPRFEIVI